MEDITAEQADRVVRGCVMYLQSAGIVMPNLSDLDEAGLAAATFQIKHFAEGYRAAVNRLTTLLSDPVMVVPDDLSELDAQA